MPRAKNRLSEDKVAITNIRKLPYMLSREDVANLAGVDPRTIVTWLKNKQVPGALKVCGKWLINRDVLLAAWGGPKPVIDPFKDEKPKEPRKRRKKAIAAGAEAVVELSQEEVAEVNGTYPIPLEAQVAGDFAEYANKVNDSELQAVIDKLGQ